MDRVDEIFGSESDLDLLEERLGFQRPVSGRSLRVVLPVNRGTVTRMEAIEAVIEDLSVWGAGVLVPEGTPIAVAQKVWIEVDGKKGLARVAFLRAVDGSPDRRCGLLFLDDRPRFAPAIARWLDALG